MTWMGMELDDDANNQTGKDGLIISTPDSKVTLLVIPTNEELEIVRQCERVLGEM